MACRVAVEALDHTLAQASVPYTLSCTLMNKFQGLISHIVKEISIALLPSLLNVTISICPLLAMFYFSVLFPLSICSAEVSLLIPNFLAAPVWPSQLMECTGFTAQDLVPCALLIYLKW